MMLTKILHLELENSIYWSLYRHLAVRSSHHPRKLTAEFELQPRLLRKPLDFEGRKRKGTEQDRCTSVRKAVS